MRVLFIDEKFGLPKNSLRLRTFEFGRRLVQNGHSVTVISGNKSTRFDLKEEPHRTVQVEGMDVVAVNSDKMTLQHFARHACKIAFKELKHPPDIVVAVTAPLNNAFAGVKISKKFNKPLVLDVRELYEEPEAINPGEKQRGSRSKTGKNTQNKLSYRLLEKYSYRHSKKIIATSPAMISGILQHNSEVEKIEHIPHYADLKAFKIGSGKEDKDKAFLKKKGIEGSFLAVCVGNSHKNTGLEYFLGAAALHSASDIGWVVAASGAVAPDLKKQVEESGLKEQVCFMENLSRSEITKLLASADCIMVLLRNAASGINGAPEIFFNTLAAGRPLITNISDWATELLLKYNAGTVVPTGSFREIARSVGSLSNRPELVKVMGENARILAAEKFDLEHIYKQYENTLTEAIRS